MLCQFCLDTGCAVPGTPAVRHGFGKAFRREKTARLELIEHTLHFVGRLGVRAQLSAQFDARMFSCRKVLECPAFQGEGGTA